MKLQNPNKKTRDPKKGEFGQECNRTVCDSQYAKWYNNSTRKYYCAACASLINRVNPEFREEHGYPLCQYDEFNTENKL